MFTNTNVYYTLLYLFVEIFFFGLYVSLVQMELFTGFLWVLEGTIVFISLLLLFHLNAEGFEVKINLQVSKHMYVLSLLFFFMFYCCFYYLIDLELKELQIFNITSFWENYYEALFNININDFKLLFISYYKVNSVEFLTIGLLLLIGSVACVNLNKYQKFIKIYKHDSFLKTFNYFVDFVDFMFLRKQNLNYQTQHQPAVKIFKKK